MLTANRVREVLGYNPKTGVFEWIVRSGSKAAQSAAGTPHKEYLNIQIDGKQYKAHRLAWLYMTGAWPSEVDHINGNGRDNRWANLRITSRGMNMQNKRRPHKNNTCGLLGVHRQGEKFRSRIFVNGKNKSLGMFDRPEQAHAAYLSAKRQYHQGNTL